MKTNQFISTVDICLFSIAVDDKQARNSRYSSVYDLNNGIAEGASLNCAHKTDPGKHNGVGKSEFTPLSTPVYLL